eukprot:c17958_g1_i1 orf=88-270(-)
MANLVCMRIEYHYWSPAQSSSDHFQGQSCVHEDKCSLPSKSVIDELFRANPVYVDKSTFP